MINIEKKEIKEWMEENSYPENDSENSSMTHSMPEGADSLPLFISVVG